MRGVTFTLKFFSLMAIVKIHYGLGNQLFQYAFARSLSLKVGYETKLDVSFYKILQEQKHPRIFQLNKFSTKLDFASPEEIKLLTDTTFLSRRWRQITNCWTPYYKRKVVLEKTLEFDPRMFEVHECSFLHGYWQDARYFEEYEDEIRKELQFEIDSDDENLETLHQIKETEAVCLHIRRGDYLTDKYSIDNVGVCSHTYYTAAIDLLASKVPNPTFFLFSDDPEWVKKNFRIKYPSKVIENNSEANAIADLQLMSSCKHQIISNSSFGWWGAWLNNYPWKVVIAPKIWRKNGPSMYMPKTWIRL